MEEKIKEEYLDTIRDFRKMRRKWKNNPEELKRKKEIDEKIKIIFPNADELRKKIEEDADSIWFALNEIKLFDEHVKELHEGDPKKVSDKCCLRLFDRQDYTDFMHTIYNALKKEIEKDKGEEK